MELAPGVECIQAPFWGRFINLVVFRGQELVLVDTGVAGVPAEAVFPYLSSVGLGPVDVSLVINTHAHADHIGGNEDLRLASGKKARFAAHRLEAPLVEDTHAATWRSLGRYVDLGIMTREGLEDLARASGPGVKLDRVLEGGEVFDLGDGVELELVPAPGHTAGNTCVLDRKSRVLVEGESVVGAAQKGPKGEVTAAPVYEYADEYVGSIATLARLDFGTFVPSHEAPMDRGAAARYLTDSLDFALRFEAEVRRRVRERRGTVTSLELWRSMDNLWGQFPADLALYIVLETHLNGLLKHGLVSGSLTGGLSWVGSDRDELAALADKAHAAIQAM